VTEEPDRATQRTAGDPPVASGAGSARLEGPGSVEAQLAKANPPPAPKDKLEEDRRSVVVERARSDLVLSQVVGYGALGIMAVQLAVADTGFLFYGLWNHWKVPAAAIEIWLAAIVVQVIGVVLLITKYLFPASGGNDSITTS
jgi:hypothetical protein